MLFIDFDEILFILFIMILIFGPDKVPFIARSIGNIIRKYREETENIKKTVIESLKDDTVNSNKKNNIDKLE